MSRSPFHHSESGRGRSTFRRYRPGVKRQGVLACRSYGSCGRTFTNWPGRLSCQILLSNPRGADLIRPHERSIPGPKQELGVDEGTQQGVARRLIKPPQPLSLRRCQAKAGHFEVLTLNAPNYLVKRLLLCCHLVLRVRELS